MFMSKHDLSYRELSTYQVLYTSQCVIEKSLAEAWCIQDVHRQTQADPGSPPHCKHCVSAVSIVRLQCLYFMRVMFVGGLEAGRFGVARRGEVAASGRDDSGKYAGSGYDGSGRL